MSIQSSLAAAVLLAASGSVVLPACSAPAPQGGRSSAAPAPDDATGTATEPIIGGTPSDASQDAVILLVQLVNGTVQAECSGTLIAPNILLTARHCVSTVTDGGFACDQNGNVAAGTGGTVGADLAADSLYVFTGAKRPAFASGNVHRAARGVSVLHPGTNVLCSNDIALVLLDTKIPNAKIAPIRLDAKPTASEKITAVGWGMVDSGSVEGDRMQRTGIPVLRVGPSNGGADGAPLPPNDFEVGESICEGDSGGPALAASGAVVGVVSRGGNGPGDPPSTCIGSRTRNVYTSTAPFKDLILQAFSQAGGAPVLESQAQPLTATGGACAADKDCQGGICLSTVGGKQVCSEPCAADGSCPTGFSCATSNGSQICAATLASVAQGSPSSGAAPSSSGGGCALAPSDATGGAWLSPALAAVALAAARRRRRRP